MISPYSSVQYSNQNINFTSRVIPSKISRIYENFVYKNILTPYMNLRARSYPDKIRSTIEPFIKKINIPTSKGNMYGWKLNPQNSEKYILFLHGMKGKSALPPNQVLLEKIMEQGEYGIITPEYRGCGDLRKQPFNFASMVEDSKATLKYLLDNGVKPENITVLAHCIGSIGATALGLEEKGINKIIMVSPIANGDGMGNAFFNKLHINAPQFIRKGLDKFIEIFLPIDMNIKKGIKKVKTPIRVIIPEKDKLVSVKQAKELSEEVTNFDGFITVPHADHSLTPNLCEIISQNLS
jgi:hypothetical protein